MSTNQKTFRFGAFDTLFFKESRPFESIGGSELSSVFPPPPRTIMGAIRTAIGDAKGVNWAAFSKGSEETREVQDIIGYGDDLGALSLDGIWFSIGSEKQRLYPVPLLLLQKSTDDGSKEFERLQIGKPVTTHLGKVCLPEMPTNKVGYTPLDSDWLTQSGLAKVLAGEKPSAGDVYESKQLFSQESRLGIAIDRQTGAVKDKMLYQSKHIRPVDDLTVEVDISGVPDGLLNKRVLRLGAEGRMSGVELVGTDSVQALPEAPVVAANTKGLILVLLTPAHFSEGSWLPSGFVVNETSEIKHWNGEVAGVNLTLHAAVIGKSQREGGWNVAEHKPRAVESLIPAGSCFYCTVDSGDDIQAAINALHGQTIGNQTELGRGRIVCALWNESEFTGTTL
ncbi:type III-B CRISPR module-associated protein Cmr3 [Leucothrix arctica]|uniref:Type III-B CRISPR module-associated protein Cmr3 n=1 Tax=Leucothrix arctica TaxID=1481894 RepID=A0A317CLC5_9GAMM|nr:type III-B CRISPR module-associated protein Cmr3 [Leucothrix arctica]PWQ99328.1 type III-B CRISPR module-associated protein Cmr3 [Leucothrix arctica]